MQDCIYRQIDINSRILGITIKKYDYNTRRVCMALLDADNPDTKKVNLTGDEIKVRFQFSDGSIETIMGEVLDSPESGKIAFTIPSSVVEQTEDVKCEVLILGSKNSEGKYTTRLSLRTFDISLLESADDEEVTTATFPEEATVNDTETT